MSDPEARFEQLIAALKERDFRLTPQRLELVRLIAVSDGHPSASQLYTTIFSSATSMNLSFDNPPGSTCCFVQFLCCIHGLFGRFSNNSLLYSNTK